MPNSIFTDNTITNYSFGDDLKLVDVHVGVSYNADPNEVRELLLEVAAADRMVIDQPAPVVRFREFGSSSLDFELRVWIRDPWAVPAVRSDLLFEIWYALKARGIEIPFPQRDLHVRSGELSVRLRQDEAVD
jgi:potassium efflux system protein